MRVQFIVEGEIKSKQRPRLTTINGYARAITAKETVEYENLIRMEYQRQCKGYYFGLLPLQIRVEAYFKPPKDIKNQMEYVSKLECMENKVICTKHKDFDNIYKIVCDALNGIAYEDDKQIWYDEGFQKFYTLGKERLEIYITDEIDIAKYMTTHDLKEIYLQFKKEEKMMESYNKLQNKLIEKGKLPPKEKQKLDDLKLLLFGEKE